MTSGIKAASVEKSARRPARAIQVSSQAPPAESPFAWLPYYLPQEEMEAVWREWGWRVVGRVPVADEDRDAFEIVCLQLQTNWGAVYRPVALLPPLQTPEHCCDDIRLFNHFLAAGWELRQQGQPVTCEALAERTERRAADIERLLPRLLSMLDTAITQPTKGTMSCNT